MLKSKNGQVLGVGIMGGSGIFHLMLLQESTEVKHSAMVAQSQRADISLWHDRLGHISTDSIHKLGNDPDVGVLLNNEDMSAHKCAACCILIGTVFIVMFLWEFSKKKTF